MDKVLGFSFKQLQLSMMAYGADLDKRDVIERFMNEVIAPPKEKKEAKILTKQEVIEVVTFLNNEQAKAYEKHLDEAKRNLDQGQDFEKNYEEVNTRVHIDMAKSRDKVYTERGIEDDDMNETIKKLDLECDADFKKMMKEHSDLMNTTLDKYTKKQ